MAAGNNIAVLVISEAGLKLADVLAGESGDFTIYAHNNLSDSCYASFDRVGNVVSELFPQVSNFVFIMAAGIAVRTLAPHLKNKLSDPGVVVVDEAGDHAISLVGGHEGGANALAYRVAAALGGQAVVSTGSEVEKSLAVGVGCRRGAAAGEIMAAITGALTRIGGPIGDVSCLATIDEKRTETGLLEAAARLDLPIRFFSAAELRTNAGWTEVSGPAMRAFGVGGVCEPAALLARRGSRLLLTKTKYEGVVVAIAVRDVPAFLGDVPGFTIFAPSVDSSKASAESRGDVPGFTIFAPSVDSSKASKDRNVPCVKAKGSLFLVGIGQGDGQMTEAAMTALLNATDIVGYKTYTKAIDHLLTGQTVHESGMGKELDRAALAVRLARDGKTVAVISSGDSGIYGMAGPILEILGDVKDEIDVRIVPGVTAAAAAASAVGAPLMNDFAVISLSDLMTPWPVIAGRIEAAAAADLVIALYNPKSRGRQKHLDKAAQMIRAHRPGSTPAAVVRNAGNDPEVCLTDLDGLSSAFVDMRSTVIIGNSQSEVINGWFITKRGYKI